MKDFDMILPGIIIIIMVIAYFIVYPILATLSQRNQRDRTK